MKNFKVTVFGLAMSACASACVAPGAQTGAIDLPNPLPTSSPSSSPSAAPSPASLTVSTGATVYSGSIDFNSIPIGGTEYVDFTLTNTGSVTAYSITGNTPDNPFAYFPGNCNGTLAAGSSCVFKMQFYPPTAGNYSSNLSFSYVSGATQLQWTASLTGAGTQSNCASTAVVTGNSAGYANANGLDDGHFYAVQFTLNSTEEIAGVDLKLTADAGVTGRVVIQIANDIGGQVAYSGGQGPGADFIDPIASVPASSLPTSGAAGISDSTINTWIAFSSPLTLAAGTYWIVIEANNIGQNGKDVYVGGDDYAGGQNNFAFQQYNFGGAWDVYAGSSAAFDVKACH